MDNEIYEDIKFLDKIYERGIIKLVTYYAIKSNLIDYYLKNSKDQETEDLPF